MYTLNTGHVTFFLNPLLKNWLVKNWTIPEKSVFKDNSHLVVYFSFFGMVFQLLLRSLFERPLLGPNCYSIFIWTCLYSQNFCQKFRVGIKSFFLIDMHFQMFQCHRFVHNEASYIFGKCNTWGSLHSEGSFRRGN